MRTGRMRTGRTRAGLLSFVVAATALMAACGGGGDRELAGFVRTPAPVVDVAPLPDVANGGTDFHLRAQPGGVLIVYFGYTNCPDFCPTTMADVRLALKKLGDDAGKVDVAMVTVDPDRDTPILADYVQSFVDDAHALATDDPALLQQVADPFGVSYQVTTNDAGEIEVAHTTYLYAVDDQGQLALTWQFGISADDIAADVKALLDGKAA
jgi:protein SCO1/2